MARGVLYQISGREQSATLNCLGVVCFRLYQISGREQSATRLFRHSLRLKLYQISGREQSATVRCCPANLYLLYQISGREQSATACRHRTSCRNCIRSAAGSNPQQDDRAVKRGHIVSDQRPGAIRNDYQGVGIGNRLYQISGREQSATSVSNTENWGLLYQISGREQSATYLQRHKEHRELYQISGREQSATIAHDSPVRLYCIRSAAGSNPQPGGVSSEFYRIVSDQRPGAIRNCDL